MQRALQSRVEIKGCRAKTIFGIRNISFETLMTAQCRDGLLASDTDDKHSIKKWMTEMRNAFIKDIIIIHIQRAALHSD